MLCGLGNTLTCCVLSYFFFQQFKYCFLWTWRYTIELSTSLSGSILFFLLISLSFFIYRAAWLTTPVAQIENSKQLSSILPNILLNFVHLTLNLSKNVSNFHSSKHFSGWFWPFSKAARGSIEKWSFFYKNFCSREYSFLINSGIF